MDTRTLLKASNSLHCIARRLPRSRGAIARSTTSLTARLATVPPHTLSRQHHPSSSVAFGSTVQVYSNMKSQGQKNSELLEQHLTPALLQGLREFWYEHLENEEDFIMPTADHSRRWYMGGKELDNVCLDRFSPALEAIRESGVTTGAEVLRAVQPREPLDWLSLVILLDQIPRNCYRGEQSKIVFKFFDPIAQQVSLEAIRQGLPDQNPQIRWNFAYRSWFYMPLMHSESLSVHDKAVEEYALLEKDVSSLTEGPGSPEADDLERRARDVIQRDVKAAKVMAEANVAFEKKHRDIIQEFGRYPHRNKAMSRKPTAAETEYLESGGETFGG